MPAKTRENPRKPEKTTSASQDKKNAQPYSKSQASRTYKIKNKNKNKNQK